MKPRKVITEIKKQTKLFESTVNPYRTSFSNDENTRKRKTITNTVVFTEFI